MKFRQTLTLHLLLYIVLCRIAFAQNVEIPDANLGNAIREALNLPAGDPITQADMLRLTKLEPRFRGIQGITDLSGLEFATNLEHLDLAMNPISDLIPLANLFQLRTLWLWQCDITDITPLANLTGLTNLDLSYNRIVDVYPLANLTNLVDLLLRDNRIVDVSPLANLTNLELLYIEGNLIIDHVPLDGLSLIEFRFDETCEMPRLPILERLQNRNFPSTVGFWGPFKDAPKHDLVCCFDFGLRAKPTLDGTKMTARSITEAKQQRDEWLSINPNMIFITEIRIHDAFPGHFPDESPYWIRDANGDRVSPTNWPGLYLINFTLPEVQEIIIQQALAVSKCGLFDGIFFDWWHEDGPSLEGYVSFEVEQHARDNIIQRIRTETKPDFLIMGNTNDRIIPRTGPHINGGFMETLMPSAKTGVHLETALATVESSLLWLEKNLREPRINSLEGFTVPTEAPDSPTNLRWMRAITTLSLTHSDGYVIFTIGPGRDYFLYDFWNADLGQPLSKETAQLYENRPGLYIREFTNGWAVYNHSGAPQIITLPEEVQGVASELVDTEHALPNLDGEMYLRVKPKNPADLNGDGVVNFLDLTLVAQAFGKDGLEADVNGDGVVNVFDLVFVANQF